MLVEVPEISQRIGEPRRRWFSDAFFDLIVWIDPEGRPNGFQLIYGTGPKAHALTLRPQTSNLCHESYDDGESRPGMPKYSPVFGQATQEIPDGIVERFDEASKGITRELRDFVRCRLKPNNGEVL